MNQPKSSAAFAVSAVQVPAPVAIKQNYAVERSHDRYRHIQNGPKQPVIKLIVAITLNINK